MQQPIHMNRPQPNRWKVGGTPSRWKVADPTSGTTYGYCETLLEAEKLAADFNGRYNLHLVIKQR